MLYALCVFLFGLVFTLFLLPYPLVFLTAHGLVFFQALYCLRKGAPVFLILLTVIALLLFPLLGNTHEGLSAFVASGLLWSSLFTLLIVQIAHGIFPDPKQNAPPQAQSFQSGYSPEAARIALQSTLVVLPTMAAFLYFNWTSQAAVMLYIGIISLSGDLISSKRGAEKSLISTAIGGLAALFFYALIIAVPEYYFFVVLMLLTSILFGILVFSGKPSVGYYPSALTGLVILISTSMGEGTSLEANYLKRLLCIALAGVYVISALNYVERLLSSRESG